MSSRLALAILGTLALVSLAACSANQPAATTPSPSAVAIVRPDPTPVPQSDAPTPVAPTPSANAGDVEGGYPELTVVATDDEAMIVSVLDPSAKAWRIVVAGTGSASGDRLEIVVETSDVEPAVEAREIQDGTLVDVMDLSNLDDLTSAAGGCHRTLPVCVDTDGIQLPTDGNGLLSIRLELPDPAARLTITGGTAGWPAEPFILGSWTETDPFIWE